MLGLGNPGIKYARTRHNVGADCVAVLAARHGEQLTPSRRERAETAELRLQPGGVRVVVAVSTTFYNEAGAAVAALVKRHGIDDPAKVVIVHDELDLPVGRLKVKFGGGLAGNKGLKSIQGHLGTDAFVRIRLGVDKPPGSQSGADHVLRQPGKAERAELDIVIEEAADAVEAIALDGLDRAMERYNRRS